VRFTVAMAARMGYRAASGPGLCGGRVVTIYRENAVDLEVAIVSARDDDAAALIAAMDGGGSAALASAPGCRSVKVLPGVENPGNVLFLVEWDSAEAHAAAKSSPGFARFIELASPHFGGSGSMQHFRLG
jgi:quinol monooxygenase YgiN